MKLAMFGIHQQLKDIDPTAKLVAQIHDELLIEVAEDKADAVLARQSVMVSAGQEIFGDGIEMVAEGGIGDSGEPLSNEAVLHGITDCPNCGSQTAELFLQNPSKAVVLL